VKANANANARVLGILAVAGFGAVIACSSSSSNNGTTGDGGSSGSSGSSGGSSSGSSGSSGSSSGSTDGGSSSGGTVKTGLLSATQITIVAGSQTIYSTSLFATFIAASAGSSGGGGNSPCTTTTEGSCKVTDCTFATSDAGPTDAGPRPDAGPAPDAGPVMADNAGVLTIKGGKLAAAGVTLSPGANGAYSPTTGSTQIFAGGDTVTVDAVGAQVPAFSGKALQTPNDIVLTSPTFDTAAKTSFPRDADLNVAWTGGGTGNLNVNVTSIRSGTRSVTIACTFGASGGTGVVPTAALSKLDQTDGTTVFGSISIQPQNSVPFTSGDWNVTFTTTATGKSGLFTTTN